MMTVMTSQGEDHAETAEELVTSALTVVDDVSERDLRPCLPPSLQHTARA